MLFRCLKHSVYFKDITRCLFMFFYRCLHYDTCRWPVYPTVPGYNFVDEMSSLNPYFICSVQRNASLFVYLSVGGLNSPPLPGLLHHGYGRWHRQLGGHQRWGEVRQTVGDVCGCLLEFLNISIDTSIQMLSEYDIHVYSFCGQAIQSLVDCVLIRFITISISQCHTLGPLVSILGSQCLQPPRYRSSYVWV